MVEGNFSRGNVRSLEELINEKLTVFFCKWGGHSVQRTVFNTPFLVTPVAAKDHPIIGYNVIEEFVCGSDPDKVKFVISMTIPSLPNISYVDLKRTITENFDSEICVVTTRKRTDIIEQRVGNVYVWRWSVIKNRDILSQVREFTERTSSVWMSGQSGEGSLSDVPQRNKFRDSHPKRNNCRNHQCC